MWVLNIALPIVKCCLLDILENSFSPSADRLCVFENENLNCIEKPVQAARDSKLWFVLMTVFYNNNII